MKIRFIDINCDVGEGIGNESDIFPYISSCNIACGGHAGDDISMKEIVILAKKHGVKVGAHPSYPDKANFGRSTIDISSKALIRSIREQIMALDYILKEHDTLLHHIKPHGALYNDIAQDDKLAEVFLESIDEYRTRSKLYVPYGSVIALKALAIGHAISYEAFGDRNYNPNLSLVSRHEDNALIEEPVHVLEHLLTMVNDSKVKTIFGDRKKIIADTYCIHGDTSTAMEILMYLSAQLPKHNIAIR